jgi:hypothetical protein
VLHDDLRAEHLEPEQVLVDRASPDLAATGQRDLGAAVAGEERPEDEDAGAHLPHELVRRLGHDLPTGGLDPHLGDVHRDAAPERPQELARRLNVPEAGDVAQAAFAVGKQCGAEDRQGRILGTADPNRASELTRAAHANRVHGPGLYIE